MFINIYMYEYIMDLMDLVDFGGGGGYINMYKF